MTRSGAVGKKILIANLSATQGSSLYSIANHIRCDMSVRRRRPIGCASETCRTTALPNKAPHNYDTKKKTNDAFDPIGPVRRNLRPAGNRCRKRGLSRIDPVE